MNPITALVLRRMRAPLLLLISAYSISMLGFVLIPGLDDQGKPYNMDFLHAFYFVGFTASTTGFGEIPYAFTEHQRMWTMFSMYLTVLAWFYSIGAIFGLIREPAFKYAVTRSHFRRQAKNIRENFYIVCGYGDTGSTVVKELNREYVPCTVLDISADAINNLSLNNENIYSPGITGDARIPENLLIAGLRNPHCKGVMALTNDDHANLKVAITSKLLRPHLPVICRADSPGEAANMASFGTDHIISAYDYFADRLAMSIINPELRRLKETLGRPTNSKIPTLRRPPNGPWIICGYGKAGKSLYKLLSFYGIECTVIERDDTLKDPVVKNWISGRGTEAVTLKLGGLDNAVGVIAATSDDADNLSIVMTARQERPDVYIVARQNQHQNDSLFLAAHIDWLMQPWRVVSNNITSILRAPVLADFLREIRHQSVEWVNPVMEKLLQLNHKRTPYIWSISINDRQCPAVAHMLKETSVKLGALLKDPREAENELRLLPLMVSRDGERLTLPDCDLDLVFEDKILFCGDAQAKARLDWTLCNHNALTYVMTGETRPDGYIWRWLRKQEQTHHDQEEQTT